jgi:hypothetical protein
MEKYQKDIRKIQDTDGEWYSYDNNQSIYLVNPWSGRPRELKKTDELNLSLWATMMDNDLRDHLHRQLSPCSDWDFLKAWSELVDTAEVSRIVLGA